MKLQFSDTLQKQAIDLFFEIKGDDSEREIICEKAEVKWSLEISYSSWGIEGFNYELLELLMPIKIITVEGIETTEETLVYAEIKYNKKKRDYICRIYEDIQKEGGKWEEEDYAYFPIELIVEESPSKDDGGRAQLFVKYITLDLTSNNKKISLTI